MSEFVCVDASVAVKWVLPEEHSDLALRFYEDAARASTIIIGPPHLPIEVVNAIRRREARQLISSDEADELLRLFLGFEVQLALPKGLHETALRLARTFDRPTVYDTHYVALANLAGCDLWTADDILVNSLGGRMKNVRSIRDYS